MRTYIFDLYRPQGPGPWDAEPDKAQWVDETTGLDCLIVRNHGGALCGYVGVPSEHPWHGAPFYSVPDVRVHNGLSFSDFCQVGAGDGPGICHIPEPGRPADVWWFGFHCAGAYDTSPKFEEARTEYGCNVSDLFPGEYRDFTYVKEQVTLLAKQLVNPDKETNSA